MTLQVSGEHFVSPQLCSELSPWDRLTDSDCIGLAVRVYLTHTITADSVSGNVVHERVYSSVQLDKSRVEKEFTVIYLGLSRLHDTFLSFSSITGGFPP